MHLPGKHRIRPSESCHASRIGLSDGMRLLLSDIVAAVIMHALVPRVVSVTIDRHAWYLARTLSQDRMTSPGRENKSTRHRKVLVFGVVSPSRRTTLTPVAKEWASRAFRLPLKDPDPDAARNLALTNPVPKAPREDHDRAYTRLRMERWFLRHGGEDDSDS